MKNFEGNYKINGKARIIDYNTNKKGKVLHKGQIEITKLQNNFYNIEIKIVTNTNIVNRKKNIILKNVFLLNNKKLEGSFNGENNSWIYFFKNKLYTKFIHKTYNEEKNENFVIYGKLRLYKQ